MISRFAFRALVPRLTLVTSTALLLLLPSWLCWSRRSARVLQTLSVVELFAAGACSDAGVMRLQAAGGLTLALAQFELTEEASGVRGVIVVLGMLQVGLACLSAVLPRGGRRVD